jgi:hypothetical protein
MVNGLVIGALAAGYLVVQHGEGPGEVGERARDYLSRIMDPAVEASATPPTKAMAVALDPQELHSPAPRESDERPLVTREIPNSGPSLESRWANFAAGPASVPEGAEFPWRHCFSRAAASYDLPESLLLAVASGESGFDAAARSPKDAVGLMQIRWPQTSRHLGIHREADLYDPCTNVDAGARYLRELMSQFGNDLHLSLAAYNYGPSRISAGAMPDGALWYSQYIYQHLQQVLGADHIPSSELLHPAAEPAGGHLVLMRFNRPQRARDFVHFLQGQVPELDVQQRSESLGQHEVVLLFRDRRERERILASLTAAGLDSLVTGAGRSHTL